jgi:hypothetical protein
VEHLSFELGPSVDGDVRHACEAANNCFVDELGDSFRRELLEGTSLGPQDRWFDSLDDIVESPFARGHVNTINIKMTEDRSLPGFVIWYHRNPLDGFLALDAGTDEVRDVGVHVGPMETVSKLLVNSVASSMATIVVRLSHDSLSFGFVLDNESSQVGRVLLGSEPYPALVKHISARGFEKTQLLSVCNKERRVGSVF